MYHQMRRYMEVYLVNSNIETHPGFGELCNISWLWGLSFSFQKLPWEEALGLYGLFWGRLKNTKGWGVGRGRPILGVFNSMYSAYQRAIYMIFTCWNTTYVMPALITYKKTQFTNYVWELQNRESLAFPENQVWFPTSTWWLTAIWNCFSWGPNALFSLQGHQECTSYT